MGLVNQKQQGDKHGCRKFRNFDSDGVAYSSTLIKNLDF